MKDITSKYIGKKYEHNGREDTLDCLGLVVSFLRDNDIYLPYDDGQKIEKNWYDKEPQRLVEGLKKYGDVISFENIKPLDVVIFAFAEGIPTHAGVMINKYRFLHILEDNPARLSQIKRWKKYFYIAFRIEEEGD